MNTQAKTIVTPKKFILNGIYFGPEKAENVFVYIHGLGGNMFRQKELIEKLVSKKSAVLAFNNRGSEIINKIKQIDKKQSSGYKSHFIGMAHEVFTDCIDDIDGAINCVKTIGSKNIFLLGHSTGCQKSVYYLAKKRNASVKGVILLAPMSDFADVYTFVDKKIYNKARARAEKMVSIGKPNELMPKNIWPYILDAQRFLSLHTSNSAEEIFCYATDREPKILKSVPVPLLVVLAGDDEHRDRPMEQISDWFKKNCSKQKCEIRIISSSRHKFDGHIGELVSLINGWSLRGKK